MDQQEDQDGITAYHGSPHDFDKFDISKIGTGEGAQAYGHGLYFAQAEPVAEGYRNRLAGHIPGAVQIGDEKHPHWATRDVAKAFSKLGYDPQTSVIAAHLINEAKGDLTKASADVWNNENIPDSVHEAIHKAEFATPAGKMYEVHINAHPDHFLDWDIPLNEQPHIYSKLGVLAKSNDKNVKNFYQYIVGEGNDTGANLYHAMTDKNVLGLSQKRASTMLHDLGIKGIKYLDAGSRVPPPNLDPIHIRGQIKRNRDQAAQVTDEAHRADLDDDHQILLDRLKRAEQHGSHNYVVFDDKLVNVKRKYAEGGEVPKYPLAEDHKDHLTEMSPDEFLDRARPLKDTAEDKRVISTFKKGMERGDKLDPLALYPDNQENGRHRATAAKELGIKKVPVHDYRKGKKKGGIVDRAIMVISSQPKGSGDAR